jgi:hypothetical protein
MRKEGVGTMYRLSSGILFDRYRQRSLFFLKMFLLVSMGLFRFHYQVVFIIW